MGNCNFIGGKVTNNVATRGGLVGQFWWVNFRPITGIPGRRWFPPSFYLGLAYQQKKIIILSQNIKASLTTV
jgi:hypothetical protein